MADLTLFERALRHISPASAERRVSARLRLEAMMNFDAASLGRRTQGWRAPNTDADAAAFGSRQRLRSLSRDMIRNRPYAARAQMVIVANVVGSMIAPSVEAENDKIAAEVNRLIQAHLMTPSLDALGANPLPAMQRIVMNTVFSDGEVFARLRPKTGRFAAGLELPFRIELFEADMLDPVRTANGENEVIEGIEYDPVGAPVAYWVLKQHPGSASRNFRSASYDSERVRASDIIHVRRTDRPGQVRGVPWLAPAMMTLGELADYQEAQILKQRMAALLAFFVKSESEPYQGQSLKEVGPGAVVGLGADMDVVPTQPPTVDGYVEFMHEGLRAVAMATGITFESLSGYLKDVNFSSGRMGRMEMDKLVESWQHQIAIGQFCAGVTEWFTRYAVPQSRGQGGLIRPGSFEIKWTAPRRALIDPTKEIPATLKAIEGELTSLQREQRRLGNDPDTIQRERQEDAARSIPQEENTDAGV